MHDAVVRGGVEPAAARCGLAPSLTATLPKHESRAAELLSDLHELNRMGRPAKVWMWTAIALLGSRSEAAQLRCIIKKTKNGADLVARPPLAHKRGEARSPFSLLGQPEQTGRITRSGLSGSLDPPCSGCRPRK